MKKLPISDIKIRKRHRKKLGDLESLKQSIEDIGLLHPVVINEENVLIAGRRRLEAYKLTKERVVPVTVIPLQQIVLGEYAENAERLDLQVSESVAIAAEVQAIEDREAAKRRKETEGRPKKGSRKTTGDSPAVSDEPRRATTKTAKAVGMGRQKLERAREVVEAADADPEEFGDLVEEMDRTGRVTGVHKKLKNRRQVAQIAKEPPPLPKGPFRVIVADPPWAYEKRASDASHREVSPFPSMSIRDIKAMDVEAMACTNCILWLWTTNAHMEEAFGVVKKWGFMQKTILTWVKNKLGMGDWLRGKTEHCLLAVRGKPTVTTCDSGEAPTTVIHGKVREHSRKPEEFYELVERLCPGSKLELFARERRKGWTVHGSETGKFTR